MKNLDLSIICVSYNSNERLEKLVTNLNKNLKIVIVENSNNKKLKRKLIKYNKNIKFYFPKINNGFGAGLNYGLKKIKTKYILYLDLDTRITSRQVKQIYNKAKLTKNFGVITVKIKGQNYKNLILGNDLDLNVKIGSEFYISSEIIENANPSYWATVSLRLIYSFQSLFDS